jgi:ferrous iron transport protein A
MQRARLDTHNPGVTVRVAEIAGEDDLARRLFDLGFWPGTEVEVVRRAPFGDPTEYRLRGFRVALRQGEAARVLVTP